MYHVIKMYGDCEPWWFLDGWEEDIVTNQEFSSYEDALRAYRNEWLYLSETYPQEKSQAGDMAAFWDPEDQEWCEECDEYLQQFHSLLLLEEKDYALRGSQVKGTGQRVRPCKIKN